MRRLKTATPIGAAFFLALAPLVPLSARAFFCTAKNLTYVGQSFIDSLVNRALYFLSSVDDPGSGITRDQAISSAVEIAQKLRGIAQRDANQKYILGKVNDLEGQIYLEEKGLLLEKAQWRQKCISEIIPQYNGALGAARPDFRGLWNFHGQMASIDPAAAADVEISIKKRASALAGEVPASMEAELAKGNIDQARDELLYCRVNGDYLGLSPSRYAALAAKFDARATLEDERTFVAMALERFKTALTRNKIGSAAQEKTLLREKIGSLRSSVISFEWSRLNKEYELLASKLAAKEDSLVAAATTALRRRGPSAAAVILDTMKSRGVARERIAKVDRLILETVIVQRQRDLADTAPSLAMAPDTAANESVLNDLLESARKRAREKNDSLAAVESERSRYTQVDEVRKDRLRIAYDLRKMREEEKVSVDKERALQELVEIYTSIEVHKPQDAVRRFSESKAFLQSTIPPEDFAKVASVVEKRRREDGGK